MSRAIVTASPPGTSFLSILMVASEALPFAKTGGLADVLGALPSALRRLGHEVTVVMPRYRDVGIVGPATQRLDISMGGRPFSLGLVEVLRDAGERVVLVDCAELYDRNGLYRTGSVDYADNAIRFGVLCRAALEYASRLETPPSVVHAHDWQAGLVPVVLRTEYSAGRRWRRVPAVFTIHNLAYQGLFPADSMAMLGLDPALFTVDGVEFWNQVGFLKGGINFADAITTVSRTYARQILTPQYGEGLDGLLVHRRQLLTGIVNGIELGVWDPGADQWLPVPYSAEDLSGKRAVKRKLLESYGFNDGTAAMGRPLVGMVSRMVDQKGMDLIWEAREALGAMNATFAVLGTGSPRYEDMWRELAKTQPNKFGVRVGFNEALAHLIEGGADIFLMPSRFEPCGLNQMYSMRYGTVPVVRATGGLADTVREFDRETGSGTGFVFQDYSASAMLAALERALSVFGSPTEWRRIQQAGMQQDFSWDAPAAEYVRVYRAAIERRSALCEE